MDSRKLVKTATEKENGSTENKIKKEINVCIKYDLLSQRLPFCWIVFSISTFLFSQKTSFIAHETKNI